MPAISAATMRSGHAVAVPQTPNAATITAMFPMASLREQSHIFSPGGNSIHLGRKHHLSGATPVRPVMAAFVGHAMPPFPKAL